jgi:hypothetical protein
VIGVKDEAELHMLVMYVVELRRPSLFSILIDGVFREICRASRGATRSCRVFERIETFYLHLSRIIAAGRSTRAFTCMHVASRMASSPDSANWILTIAIVARTVEYLTELAQPLLQDGIGLVSLETWRSRSTGIVEIQLA